MKKLSLTLATLVTVLYVSAVGGVGPDELANVSKEHKRYTVPVALQFTKKDRNSVQRALSVLVGLMPNGYATGFMVGDGLVMTCYHVVSGDLDLSKRRILGFKPGDELEVKAYVNSCEARVVKSDPDADLALLKLCESSVQARRPAFDMSPNRNDPLVLIAQPGESKLVRRAVFHGSYSYRGQEYWSIKTEIRDGFSGSPVYNEAGEVVGVFSGYDWNQDLAIIIPAEKAKQLLAEYEAAAHSQPTR